MATQMGMALRKAGHDIRQVYSRSEDSARQLADKLGCQSTTDADAIATADVALFMLTDTALGEMAARVCPRHPEMLHIHTAGSIPLSLFEGKARRYGVLYPMQTFSKERAVDFSQIPCYVEASDARSLNEITQLAGSISEMVRPVASADRRYLHLAAVFASNMANHCYHIAQQLCADHGIDFADLHPLISETAQKVGEMSPHDAQTGPAVRADRGVMAAQMRLLEAYPEAKEIYRLMSADIERMR